MNWFTVGIITVASKAVKFVFTTRIASVNATKNEQKLGLLRTAKCQ